jgi:hypothetical protein
MPHEIPRQPSNEDYERHSVLKESISRSIFERRPWPYSGAENETRLLSIQWMSLQCAEDGWVAIGLTTDGCYVRVGSSDNADDVTFEVEPKQADGETDTSQGS